MILVVDKQNGPYRTISEAVASAQKNTEIRIASGLYTDNVEIKTPGLRLVPKDKDADIIWVAYVGPAITVNIPDDGKVYINNIKLAHTAISVMPKEKQKETEQAELFLNALSVENQEKVLSDQKDPNSSFAKTLIVYGKMNTLIYVKKGKLEIAVGFGDEGFCIISELHPETRRLANARSGFVGGEFCQIHRRGDQGEDDQSYYGHPVSKREPGSGGVQHKQPLERRHLDLQQY